MRIQWMRWSWVSAHAMIVAWGIAISGTMAEVSPNLQADSIPVASTEAGMTSATTAAGTANVIATEVTTGQPVLHAGLQEEIPAGEAIPESAFSQSAGGEPLAGDSTIDLGIESGRTYGLEDPLATSAGGSSKQWPSRFRIRAEYLMWWTKGMHVPPLVTTSTDGTARAEAGVLGYDTTMVLLGNETLLRDMRSGGRIRIGSWLDSCQLLGVEVEYLGLENVADHYYFESDGSLILGRPFDNVLLGPKPDAELTGFPNALAGNITVDAKGQFQSGAASLLVNRWCRPVCWRSWRCGPTASSGHRRLDVLIGYRFLSIDEDLRIAEQVGSIDPNDPLPASFDILDTFGTQNEFHGGEIGLIYETRGTRWSLEVRGKVALGTMHQTVMIDGSTEITINNTPLRYSGGILAQRTNMGRYERDQFCIVPELDLTLGYQLTPRLRATVGYSFISVSNVARPGDQIDTVLNPNLFPPEADPFSGMLRPRFAFQDSSYWAQGLSFGADYRW